MTGKFSKENRLVGLVREGEEGWRKCGVEREAGCGTTACKGTQVVAYRLLSLSVFVDDNYNFTNVIHSEPLL